MVTGCLLFFKTKIKEGKDRVARATRYSKLLYKREPTLDNMLLGGKPRPVISPGNSKRRKKESFFHYRARATILRE